MKVFDKIDAQQMSAAWKNRFDPTKSFYGGKDVPFTPAVQAQVSPYGSPGTGEMPAYASLHSILIPYEFTGWMDECDSITKTCYIGDWSWLNKQRLWGRDALECLKASTINGYNDFPIGKGRHIVSVTPEGKMIGEGIAFREGENEFFLTGGSTVAPGQMIKLEGFDAQMEEVTEQYYNFHIQGPNSRKVVEKLCGKDVGDLGFLCFREVRMLDRPVRLYRGGMSGELGYEIFGPSEDGSVIWKTVVDAGQEFGIRQLGYRGFMLNHLQAFFPTIWIDYLPANMPEEAHADALYRSPVDFGWGNLIDKTRDFPGKAALMEEMAHPTRKAVMLEWNAEDCIAIYASLFDTENETFSQMEMPVNVSAPASGAPMVLPVFAKEGPMIGFASNRGYSHLFKKVLSITVLDIRYTEPGTEVCVLYGDQGKRQMMIRATVAEAPYKKDNRK